MGERAGPAQPDTMSWLKGDAIVAVDFIRIIRVFLEEWSDVEREREFSFVMVDVIIYYCEGWMWVGLLTRSALVVGYHRGARTVLGEREEGAEKSGFGVVGGWVVRGCRGTEYTD